jgi:hypothetical protein
LVGLTVNEKWQITNSKWQLQSYASNSCRFNHIFDFVGLWSLLAVWLASGNERRQRVQSDADSHRLHCVRIGLRCRIRNPQRPWRQAVIEDFVASVDSFFFADNRLLDSGNRHYIFRKHFDNGSVWREVKKYFEFELSFRD